MSNVTTRIRGFSTDTRARLARLLQQKLEESKKKQTFDGEYDVVILGGGLAGSTLAIQLKQERPEISILVVEKRQHPVPEAAFKVGESTIELGSHYLRDVLGLAKHLETYQLPKAGLRYFFPAGDNSDITQRIELGATMILPVSTHQLDRGSFENMLREKNMELGVTFWHGCKASEVSFGASQHVVTLNRDDEQLTVSTRWVVDASGRRGMLKRKLGLVQNVGHDASAVWFRIDEPIDIGSWSEDERWCAHVPSGLRRLSTNHLMGRGYWVWLIPLPSGATSVGIVADPRLHPHNKMNRFERAMEWLYQHEPQCAKMIDQKRDHVLDFRALKHYAHGCEQLFSAQRWCLTGEAGVFVDPFYSVGTDFIGLSNSFIKELVLRDLDGLDIQVHAEQFNRLYLDTFNSYIGTYEKQYPLMGNAQVMSAKVIWDFSIYWGVNALLFFHKKSYDLQFLRSVADPLRRFDNLNVCMQAFFREWDQLGQQEWASTFINYMNINFIDDLHHGLEAGLNDEKLKDQVFQNIDLLETIAGGIFQYALDQLSQIFDEESKSNTIRRWQANGFFSLKKEVSKEVHYDLNKIWFD